MNKSFILGKVGVLLALCAMFFSSCENSVIFDGEGDCQVQYRIKFKYDKNMAGKYQVEMSSELAWMLCTGRFAQYWKMLVEFGGDF